MIAEEAGILMQVVVPARAAATAWNNTFLAASTDEDRPVLCKTLCIEHFDAGIQLIGCDGTVLFRTWIPVEDENGNEGEWPTVAEVPDQSIVIMDPDGFGIGFMRALLRVTGEEEHQFEKLTITTSHADDEANLALGDNFLSARVTLRALGQRIDLRLLDGPYPDWRNVRLGIDAAERVEGMTVATRILALVGKLKSVNAVDLEFYGDKKHVVFTARGDSEVRGFLMPMRRRDQPNE